MKEVRRQKAEVRSMDLELKGYIERAMVSTRPINVTM